MSVIGKTILVSVAVGFCTYWTWMVNATGEEIGFKAGYAKGYAESAAKEREQILLDDAFKQRFEFNAARSDWQEFSVKGQAIYFSTLAKPRSFPVPMNYLRVKKGWISWSPESFDNDALDSLLGPLPSPPEKATPKKL